MYKIKMHQTFTYGHVKQTIKVNNKAVLYSIKLINKYGKYGDIEAKQKYTKKYKNNCGPNTFDAPIFLDYQNKLDIFGGLYLDDIINARYKLFKYIKQITNILNLEDEEKYGGQLEWELK